MPYSQLLWLAIIGRVWSFAGFKPHLHLHSNFIHNLFDELNYSLTNVCRSVRLSLYLDAAVLATISEHWQIDPCILNHHRMDNVNEHGQKFKPQAKISANMFSLLSHHNRNKFYLSLPFISMPSRLVSSRLALSALPWSNRQTGRLTSHYRWQCRLSSRATWSHRLCPCNSTWAMARKCLWDSVVLGSWLGKNGDNITSRYWLVNICSLLAKVVKR